MYRFTICCLVPLVFTHDHCPKSDISCEIFHGKDTSIIIHRQYLFNVVVCFPDQGKQKTMKHFSP